MFYADMNGSTPICSSVEDKIQYFLKERFFGNPNASHSMGVKLLKEIEDSRKFIGQILGANKDQIIFNSGSSEGISHVFYSLLMPLLLNERIPSSQRKKKVIISKIEHSCIINAAQYYQNLGIEILWLDVAYDGVVYLDQMKEYLENYASDIVFICVMAANNETGVIQPFEKIGELAQKYHIPFICDTTQFIAKAPFSFNSSFIDFAFCSSHKIGAIIGSGFILAKNPKLLSKDFLFGGGQENSLRGGTQNYLGICAMAVALKYYDENKQHLKGLEMNRNNLEKSLRAYAKDLIIFGEDAPRLPGTSFWGIPKIPGFIIQEQLQKENIFVSTTSACCDAKQQGSRILLNMGYDEKTAKSAVRLSFCIQHSDDDFKYLEMKLAKYLH